MAKIPWVSPSELMARAMQQSGNTLVPDVAGTLRRKISFGQGLDDYRDWDLARTWSGPAVRTGRVIHSMWTKSWRVSFDDSTGEKAVFTLWLDGKLTKDEVEQAAETYAMALNVRRVD